MRKNLSPVIALLISTAQPPQKYKYQGIARNTNSTVVANQSISLRTSIHQGSAAWTVIYKETQSTLTNQLGVFNINVGAGTVVTGNFSTIRWDLNDYFQEVEMDITGGTTYVSMGTSQLLSVPYVPKCLL